MNQHALEAAKGIVIETGYPWTYTCPADYEDKQSRFASKLAEIITRLAIEPSVREATKEMREALVVLHRVMIQRNMAEDEQEVADNAWAVLAKYPEEGR
jgi:hypothetical protein